MLLDQLRGVARDLRSVLSGLEPERLTGADADRLLTVFAEIEKLASGGKLLAARRVETSNTWRRKGHRSAAAHVAEVTGTGLGQAINSLATARQLGALPATEGALRKGRLSESQVKEIAGAATVRPEAEQSLVDAATSQPLNVLKLRCQRVKASGHDQTSNYHAIRRGRYFRNWTDGDGAVRLDARLTPDEGARLLVAVKAETDHLLAEARRAGVDEPRRALTADALVRLVTSRAGARGSSGKGPDTPATMVHVRVDHAALVRGRVEPGELCEIPGVGPIPVAVARGLAADSILSVLVTKGVDVTGVAHAGRTIPAPVRRALTERDPVCVVPGCGARDDLEIDHLEPLGQGGSTTLENLVRLCHWHHYLKTHQGHRLERVEGEWRWISPGRDRSPALLRSG
jgi:Domain of unknown function (DUF222)/HNH endonuclease